GVRTSAPHATRRAELVMPGPEFVRKPMPITRRAALPDAALVHEREVEFEARSPLHPPLGVLSGEVGDILDARAEAGRAHHSAVATRQAAAGDLVPMRLFARLDQ